MIFLCICFTVTDTVTAIITIINSSFIRVPTPDGAVCSFQLFVHRLFIYISFLLRLSFLPLQFLFYCLLCAILISVMIVLNRPKMRCQDILLRNCDQMTTKDFTFLYITFYSLEKRQSVNGWPAPAGQQWYYTQKV